MIRRKRDVCKRRNILLLKRKTTGAILLAIPVFVIGMFFMHMPYGNWIMLAFTLPVMLFFGRDFFVHAYKQFRHGRANMDTLVAVSTGVAFLFSLFNTIWPEYWTDRGLEAHVYYEAAAVIIALILLGSVIGGKGQVQYFYRYKEIDGITAENRGEDRREWPGGGDPRQRSVGRGCLGR